MNRRSFLTRSLLAVAALAGIKNLPKAEAAETTITSPSPRPGYVRFRRYTAFPASTKPLAEGVVPTGRRLKRTQYDVPLKVAGQIDKELMKMSNPAILERFIVKG